MNWIKSNPFVAGLAGVTILLCGILFFLASKWAGKYDESKEGFDGAYQTVADSESIPLYPSDDNRDGKRKALGEYRQAIDDFGKLFDTYRPGEIENITPQAFTDRLKSANAELSEAFGTDTELPDNFFLGFEEYRDRLAQSGATGTLLLQLDGVQAALKGLAEARPSALIRIFREPIPEERGTAYQPGPNDVARYFPFEITFRGTESSAREFLTSLGAMESHFFIVRCLKIQNERSKPPTVSDAKFDPVRAEAPAVAPANDLFGAFFPDAPDEEPEGDDAAEPAEDAPADDAEEQAAPPAPAAELDTSRILAQVLGSEELIVFVRFDIAMFLPSTDLPQP